MNDTDSRVGLIDVLTACAAGTVGSNLDVRFRNNDGIVILKLGHNLNRCEGCVAAARCVEGGNTHKSVNSVFALQIAVGVHTLDHNGGRLQSCLVAVKPIDELNVESALLAPSYVHTVEHRSPILRLCSACAGVEGEDSVILVIRAGEENLDPLSLGLTFDVICLGNNLFNRILVACLDSHLAERVSIVKALYKLLVALKFCL